MNKQIKAFKKSGLINYCTRQLGYLLLLATKPHQEDCTDIDTFIWRSCVSYRPLNSITRSFEFHNPLCTDRIEELRDSCGIIFIISLDAYSDYYQIRVRKCDQEKLDFFTPSDKKKTYTVMPFSRKHLPAFYNAMM